MKLVASFASLVFISIVAVDGWTNTTARYTSGQLEGRLIELGTNRQSGEYFPQWRRTQEEGVRRHCARTLSAQSLSNDKCGAKTSGSF